VKFLRQILYPFSLLYYLITSIRNRMYNNGMLKSTQFKTPTIVVGNLSVGGTGKTPQIEYLIRLLQPKYKIAVLSRGYKRKSKGFILADEKVTAEIIGDEPFQYFRKFPNIIVSVDADRTNGIKQLEVLENPPEIILLDDAYQHRKVQGGLNVLLTSYNNLYVNDFMLPTGTLREAKTGTKRAQIIIVTKCPNDLSEEEQGRIIEVLNPAKNQNVFFTTIEYDHELKGEKTINLAELKKDEIVLVTGIANPKPLTEYLVSNKLNFKHLKFPDHHHFTDGQIDEINFLLTTYKLVLTTEKDYVRIFDRIKKLYFISIKTKFINHKKDFDNLINSYVGKSSRHG